MKSGPPSAEGVPQEDGAAPALGYGLLEVFWDFLGELRSAGVPVSTTEVLDAMVALQHLQLQEREALKLGLAATLVKQVGHWRTFEILFDLYFGARPSGAVLRPGDEALGDGFGGGFLPAKAVGEGLSAPELAELAYRALLEGDIEVMAALARAAVQRYAGIQPGRPGTGGYYVLKVLRQLQADVLAERLLAQARGTPGLEGLARAEEYRRNLAELRAAVEAEVRRRLVADSGARAVAKALRRPLLEDLDFMHLKTDELAELQRAVEPLARKLAAHLARKRRKRQGGRLDFRATMRHSLSTGGVPVEPRFRERSRSKPDLWVLADISGSVAAFSRFTLQLVYALSSQFSRTRSWAFVDGIDEVTELLRGSGDLASAVHAINTQAEVIWAEGHSDYGHALSELVGRWGRELTARTTVVILGDARNNYHTVEAWTIAEMAERARHVWWLNPEPRSYWDTGDSVLAHYSVHCSGVYECRNLRQLRKFVEQL